MGYYEQPVTFLTDSIVSNCVFFYIWLHLQFVREHEHALMAEQRIRLLMAQIRPHFIYNSLTAIRSYLDEPEKAEDVLNHFAGFLRGSIDVLEETGSFRADFGGKAVNHGIRENPSGKGKVSIRSFETELVERVKMCYTDRKLV